MQEILGAHVREILVAGYVDSSNPVSIVSISWDNIYLNLGVSTLRIHKSDAELALTWEVPVEEHIALDEDDSFAICSVSEQLFEFNYTDHQVKDVVGFVDVEGRLLALSLRFDEDRVLTFDPSYYWGIKIGGQGMRDRWFADQNVNRVVRAGL